MKKSVLFQLIIVILATITTGCSRMASFSYFNNFQCRTDGASYHLSGSVYLTKDDPLGLLTMSCLTENELGISGTFKHLSGNVQIVYVDPEGNDIEIADSNDASNDTFTIDTKIPVKPGIGKIQLLGDHTSFKMDIQITDINGNDYTYIAHGDSDDSADEDTNISNDPQTQSSENPKKMPDVSQSLKILNEEKKSYTELDTKDANIVLETNLEKSTPVTVRIAYHFKSTHKNMELGAMTLQYETEEGEYLPLINKEKQYAISDYEEMDTIIASITLPAGNNRLILKNVDGRNFNLSFHIKVEEVEDKD